MIKAALFDVDGTLYSHKINATPTLTIKLLKKLKEKGIIIGICTSRIPKEMVNLPKELTDLIDCMILGTGTISVIKDKYYKAYHIDPEMVKKYADYFESNNIRYSYSDIEGNLYYSGSPDDVLNGPVFNLCKDEVKYKKHTDELVTNIDYFFATDKDNKAIFEINPNANILFLKESSQICPDLVNKGFGVLKLCELYKLTSDEVVACGDGFNDEELLKLAGIGIAIKDADKEAINAADYICKKSIEDGGLYEAFVDLKIIEEDKYEPKIFFFDIDGTSFCHVIDDVRESTYKAFDKLHEKGYKICISTSRSITEAKNLPKRYVETADYFSYLSGAIVDMGDKLDVECIDDETVKKYVDYMESHNICFRYSLEDGNSYLNMHADKEMIFYRLYAMIPPVKKYDGEKVTGFLCYPNDEEAEEILKMFSNIENARLKIAIESYPKNVNKATTLRKTIEKLGYNIEDTCAFGDSGNDILMLKEAKLGIAMGNGNDRCKQAADYITGRTDEEGIYTALVHFGIIEGD